MVKIEKIMKEMDSNDILHNCQKTDESKNDYSDNCTSKEQSFNERFNGPAGAEYIPRKRKSIQILEEEGEESELTGYIHRRLSIQILDEEPEESELTDGRVADEEATRRLIGILCNHGGSENVSIVAAKVGVAPDFLKNILLKHPALFRLSNEGQQINLKLALCRSHTSHGCTRQACGMFHLCKYYVFGKCQLSENCKFGHNLSSYHNSKLREHLFLDDVSSDALLRVLSTTDDLPLAPSVCLPYNRNKCLNTGFSCHDLHICLREVTSHCDDANCIVQNHDILNKDCKALLEKRGIPVNQSRREIATLVMQRLLNNKEAEEFLKALEQQKANRRSLKAENVEDGNVEIVEICIPYLKGKCWNDRPGTRCKRLHSKKTYHWQVCSDGKWLNLMEFLSDQLEQSYTVVSIGGVVLEVSYHEELQPGQKILEKVLNPDKWTADYSGRKIKLSNSNATKVLDLRRLGTESFVNTSDSQATDWRWYFLHDSQKWVEYGERDSDGIVRCNINSNQIEKEYQENMNGTITFFSEEHDSCTIDFQTMKETKTQTRTERCIRRRPALSSSIKELKADYRHIPTNWTSMSSEDQCNLVMVQENSPEYREIQQFFQKTLNRTPIVKSIKRVQNPYLWEMYENRKKHMSKCLGREESTIDKRLFHGTSRKNIDAIANQNFDWRLHGSSTGQLYGRGVYFASTSSYSDDYTVQKDNYDVMNTTRMALLPLLGLSLKDVEGLQKEMFIARVLVGNMIQGDPSMIRPSPLPGNPYAAYDTSVDDMTNPTIYVKYADQEMYPEYVITYT